ncbi:MAG: hypothetical protein ACREMY_00910 [bacterium]
MRTGYCSNFPTNILNSVALNAGREHRLLLQTNAAAFVIAGYSTDDPGNGPSAR